LLGSNQEELPGILFTVDGVYANDEEYTADLYRYFGDDWLTVAQLYPWTSYGSREKALGVAMSDWIFVCPARRTARAMAASGQGDVYLYNFTEKFNTIWSYLLDVGSFHALELLFVFHKDSWAPLFYALNTYWDDQLSLRMVRYWTRFARTGDPNGGADVVWPAYEQATDRHIILSSLWTRAGAWHRWHYCNFWDTHESYNALNQN
jgi:para-nitrobenzyl esterase